jgi:Glutathionylspermidine synthase preATP-grasp
MMRDEAISEYHSLLNADDNLNRELFAHLREMMAVNRLSYDGRALGISLRPFLLSRRQYDKLTRSTELLVGAFDKTGDAMLADPRLMDRVGMLDMERTLALVEPGFSNPAVTTRLDAFVYDDVVKFVEYNAENPSSLTDQFGLNQILFELPAMQAFAERYRLRQFNSSEGLLKSLLDTYREWGGKEVPNVAIVDWANLPTASEFELLRNYFVGNGVPTIICPPGDLEYEGGKLRRGDFRIDLVYKRVIIHEYLARFDLTHAMTRAYINGDVCMVNPFRCKMLHKKACFELLTDDSNESWFTAQEKAVIRECVPWTRRVAERKTTHNGALVDLIEYIRKNRTDFVLKPNDDYGGHGLFLGYQSTESDWDEQIATALAEDYIVQEVIELHTENFPIFGEESWSYEPMYADLNPFVFRGKVNGAMVRLSDSPIVNVTSGGGETGLFVIEGRVERS